MCYNKNNETCEEGCIGSEPLPKCNYNCLTTSEEKNAFESCEEWCNGKIPFPKCVKKDPGGLWVALGAHFPSISQFTFRTFPIHFQLSSAHFEFISVHLPIQFHSIFSTKFNIKFRII